MKNNALGRACLFSALLLAAVLRVAADGPIGRSILHASVIRVTVPDLVGRTFTDGHLPRGTAYFTPSVTYVYDDHAPPRTILSQTPVAGAVRKVIPGGTPYPLSLVVSLGKRAISLPDTCGMDTRIAKNLLTEKGLTVEVSPVTLIDGEARHTPAHAVLDMAPAPGTVLGDADRVTLYVAEPLTDHGVCCPDTVGLTVPEAIARLTEAGLQLGEITAVEDDEKPFPHNIFHPWHLSDGARTATVIRQDKLAGSYLPRGTVISLDIS